MTYKRPAKIMSLSHKPTSKGVWPITQHYQKVGAGKWNLTTDSNFPNVAVLLHAEGSNNSTIFLDSSNNNLNLGATGTPIISTTQFKVGSSSIFFDGTSEYFNLNRFEPFTFGTGNFTIEMYSYISTAVTGYQYLFSIVHSNGVLDVRYGDGGFGNKLQVGINTNSSSSTWSTSSTKTTHTGAWKHIAFTRSGTTCRLFVDGTIQNIGNGVNPGTYPNTSFTSSTSVTGISSISIGGKSTHTSSVYLDEFRVTKGVARYTANFTPSTSAFPDM